MKRSDIDLFISRQLDSWREAAIRHEALRSVKTKSVCVGDTEWKVMFNPARSVSTNAKVDEESIKARRCFLCAENRPEMQSSVKWRDYDILVNPFPVFPGHLTIVLRAHERQLLSGRVDDFVDLAAELAGYTVFYNGAGCGASAPDHCHFQAVPEEYLPLNREYPFRRIYFTGDLDMVKKQMGQAIASLPLAGYEEPQFNAAVHNRGDGTYEAVIVPRVAHRPSCYDKVKISPGAIDMLGTVITTSAADYDAVDGELLASVFSEVAVVDETPVLRVGIMSAKEVNYSLHGDYIREGDTLFPSSPDCWFELDDVTIGVDFHWERKERQRFHGALQLMKGDDGMVTAVNIISVEEYLMSVISSEMSAEASPALLRAHAVISRSWCSPSWARRSFRRQTPARSVTQRL